MVDRRNQAETLLAQAERRLRDVALEFGPYAMERQKQVVNGASRDLQDLLQDPEASPAELDEAAAVLEDAVRVLNRCLNRGEPPRGAGTPARNSPHHWLPAGRVLH